MRDFQLDLVYPSENFGSYQTPVVTSQYNIFKQPATNVDNWNITGLLYRGNKLDILYSLKTKSVEIRNRRSNDPSISAIDDLQVITYEGTDRVEKPLRVGDSIMISLTTDSWKYTAKKPRLQTKNSYSENMHILATIHSMQFNNRVIRAVNAGNRNTMPALVTIISVFSYTFFSQLF